jgi:hypothetical protein
MAVRTPEAGEETTAPGWARPVFGPRIASSVLVAGGLLLVLLLTGWHQVRPSAGGLAAPLTAVALSPCRLLFTLDDAGRAVAGKVVASVLCALAAGALFLAAGRRHPEGAARSTAILFALGTPVWAASHFLGPRPFSLLLTTVALLCIVKAEEHPAWAGRAGLPLALCVAVEPADVALAGVLALGLAARWPRRIPLLLLWSLPGLAVLGWLWSTAEPPGPAGLGGSSRHLALLFSPARGLVVLAPVVLVVAGGLEWAFRRGERALAITLGAAAAAHWALVGFLGQSPAGGADGPLIDALPLLVLLVPEGLEARGILAAAVASLSVFAQGLIALADMPRWERLHAADEEARAASTWSVAANPVAFAVRERVLIPALPGVAGGKAFIRQYPLALQPPGSRVTFGPAGPSVTGAQPLFGDVRATGGARVEDGRLRMRAAGDGLFLRVRREARARPALELRLVGRGRGTLVVSERTFWSVEPRTVAHAVSGPFRLKHPYQYPTSGGPDLDVALGADAGTVELESVTLAVPGEPEEPIRLPAGS